ncbi:MAG: CPXCG motif-containing cysteine-rich protein [Gammaproteobacteria bacterium]|jgi:hypothetical protein
MTEPLQYLTLTCPYCGVHLTCEVDISAGSQQTVEDCPTCCAPILIDYRVQPDGRIDLIQVRREND